MTELEVLQDIYAQLQQIAIGLRFILGLLYAGAGLIVIKLLWGFLWGWLIKSA